MKTSTISSQTTNTKSSAATGSFGLVCDSSATRRMGTTHHVSPVFSSNSCPKANRGRSLVHGS